MSLWKVRRGTQDVMGTALKVNVVALYLFLL